MALSLFAFGHPSAVLWGGFFYFASVLLDHVDGNIARLRDSASYFGKFSDGVKDKIVVGFLPIALGLGAASQESAFIPLNPAQWSLTGALTGLLYMAEEVTLTRYGRFVRQIQLDGQRPRDFVLSPLSGWRRILRGFFLRGLKIGAVWRRSLTLLMPLAVVPAGGADVALVVLAALHVTTCPAMIGNAVYRAHFTINLHRRSKNHVV